MHILWITEINANHALFASHDCTKHSIQKPTMYVIYLKLLIIIWWLDTLLLCHYHTDHIWMRQIYPNFNTDCIKLNVLIEFADPFKLIEKYNEFCFCFCCFCCFCVVSIIKNVTSRTTRGCTGIFASSYGWITKCNS